MGLDMYLYRQERIGEYDLKTLLQAENYLEYESRCDEIEIKQKPITERIQNYIDDWRLDEDDLTINAEIIDDLKQYEHFNTTKYGFKYLTLSASDNNDDPEIMYWRKANAIHNWFVENVQDGVDDCDCYEVSIDQIYDLMECCRKILDTIPKLETILDSKEYDYVFPTKAVETAQEILPTTSGFFFGDTNYNYFYFQDILDTYNELKNLAEDFDSEKYFYYYHSSW